jgi:hypothetical protein
MANLSDFWRHALAIFLFFSLIDDFPFFFSRFSKNNFYQRGGIPILMCQGYVHSVCLINFHFIENS